MRSQRVYFLYLDQASGSPATKANPTGFSIDFVATQSLLQNTDFIEVRARSEDEPRYLMVGKIAGVHWSAVISYRGNKVRIISVRCSREAEVALYEG